MLCMHVLSQRTVGLREGFKSGTRQDIRQTNTGRGARTSTRENIPFQGRNQCPPLAPSLPSPPSLQPPTFFSPLSPFLHPTYFPPCLSLDGPALAEGMPVSVPV